MDLLEMLRMALYEADKGTGGEDGGEDNPDGGSDDNPEGDEGSKGTGDDPGKKDGEPKTFTQAELDAIVADRLAREKRKKDEAVEAERAKAEAERLAEQGQFKELAESLQKQLDDQKADALKVKKESLLTKAGYKDEQVALFINLLTGETDDEIDASLERIKAATPPAKSYADPSAGNGRKVDPEKKGSDDVGKTMFQRLKAKGKVK